MSDTSTFDRDRCARHCRRDFIRTTARKPVGGVEALRLCREACDVKAQSADT